jgi:hypothetical protein
MEILETNHCNSHNLPITTICTCEECDSIFLCDFCLNSHEKSHKYLITINSLKSNLYDKIIQANEVSTKNSEKILISKTNEFINKIEFDFFNIRETFLKFLTRSKNNLIEKIENVKENYIEESKIWTKLKFEYGRNYMAYINNLNKSILKIDEKSELNIGGNFIENIDNTQFENSNFNEVHAKKFCSKNDESVLNNLHLHFDTVNDFSVDEKFGNKKVKHFDEGEGEAEDEGQKNGDIMIDESLRNLLNSISTVIEKMQNAFTNNDEENSNNNLNSNVNLNPDEINQNPNFNDNNNDNIYKKPKTHTQTRRNSHNDKTVNKEAKFEQKLLNDFNKTIFKQINEDFSIMKSDLNKFCEEKVYFTNSEKFIKNSIFINCNSTGTLNPYKSPKENLPSPTYKNSLSPIILTEPIKSNNLKTHSYNLSSVTPTKSNKITIKNFRMTEINATNRYSLNNIHPDIPQLTSSQNVENFLCTKNLIFNPDNFKLSDSIDIFPEKKGAWYSLEYIEYLDYIVCGYHSGEILIYKESDLTLIRTYRPRFKRIRKIIYSPENSSIFASYDDGYIAVINLTNYKVATYKISNSQIYTMEIMPNYNILIFGGVEKKIKFSYIIDLNKSLLFYDSSEGEIQALFYEENSDVLVASMRKSCVIFFKYQTGDVIVKHKLAERDCCGMAIKKYKDDSILVCGYFINLHQFKFCENNVIQYVGVINIDVIHIYDFLKLDDRDNFILINTYDEGKLVLVNMKNKKCFKVFDCVKGVIQMKLIKNYCYLTNHSECVKKIKINY